MIQSVTQETRPKQPELLTDADVALWLQAAVIVGEYEKWVAERKRAGLGRRLTRWLDENPPTHEEALLAMERYFSRA
jgi:hypothetical protein